MTTNNAVLITAAGTSQRFGEKKEFFPLHSDTHTSVLSACLYAFVKAGRFSRYVITVPAGQIETAYALLTADTRLSSFLKKKKTVSILLKEVQPVRNRYTKDCYRLRIRA